MNMTHALKKAPYGQASFTTLREFDFAYVDKTKFIPVLEECGTFFPFIVRPRRFGKSVFADMLTAYYDRAAAQNFKTNFSGTWIGKHPTPLANQFLVLKFDFSGISNGENLILNFIQKVKDGMQDFVLRYLPQDRQMQDVLDAEYTSPVTLLLEFLRLVPVKIKGKLYLIIDEYDQFAQEVLSRDPERFRAMTGAEGFLKAFYACLKEATLKKIGRIYITGVTSISLDSMTSGFNIAKNLSASPMCAAVFGFTHDELRGLIPQIVDVERYGHSVDQIFDRMKVLYDGYRFSAKSDVTVFNSSMCLYYLGEIADTNEEPEVLLDPAFSVDLSKIEGLLSLGRREFVDNVVSKVLMDQSISIGTLSGAINLNASAALSDDDLLTALVFMGFLTFSQENSSRLVCPNLAVKEVFFNYWFQWIGKGNRLSFPSSDLARAMQKLESGDAAPILKLVSERLTQCVGSHAHAHLSETVIQFAACMALNTSWNYKVTVEEEATGSGFTDLVLRPNKCRPDVAGWLIEFKYLKKSEAKQTAIDAKLDEAAEQLTRYAAAENIANIPNLRKAAVVFAGTELKGLKVF